jgi:predicted esterase
MYNINLNWQRLAYNFGLLFVMASLIVYFLLPPFGFFHTNRSRHRDYGDNYKVEYYQNAQGIDLDLIISDNPSTPNTDHILLYMHGTTERQRFFLDDGSLYMPVASATAPGYHFNQGQPTTTSFVESLDFAVQKLNELGYSSDKIIVMGHSLGSIAALGVAQKHPDLNRVIVVNGLYDTTSMCWGMVNILCGLSHFHPHNGRQAKQITDTNIHIFVNPKDEFIPANNSLKLFNDITSPNKKFFLTSTNGSHGSPTVKEIIRQSLEADPVEICTDCDNINDLVFADQDQRPSANPTREAPRINQLGRVTSLWLILSGMMVALLVSIIYILLKSKLFAIDSVARFVSESKVSWLLSDGLLWAACGLVIVLSGLQIPIWYWRVTDMDDFINFVLIFLPPLALFPIFIYKLENYFKFPR